MDRLKLLRAAVLLGSASEHIFFKWNIFFLIFFAGFFLCVKMQRVSVLRRVSALPTLQRRGYYDNVQKRYLATVKEIFPHKTDFPSRHIGPRKTEVVAMLDYIGYKVRISVFY